MQDKQKKTSLNSQPKHIAIIMDGNGRWAESKNLSRVDGHKKGVETAKEIINASKSLGIRYLTLFTFSTENWKRPKDEINELFSLFLKTINEEKENFEKDKIKVKFIGSKNYLNEEIIDRMNEIENKKILSEKLTLIFAFNYGSKLEIIDAVKNIGENLLSQKINIEDINEEYFSANLYTKDIPNPDLLIRTSGEYRLSNFLLWQLAYSELFFSSTLWPDFSKEEYEQIISSFQKRKRKFGGL